MTSLWLGTAVAAAVTGAVATPVLAVWGLACLARPDAMSRGLSLAGALGGIAAGAAAMATTHRTGIWWLAPALVVWGCALIAAACCDAVTQRVPTALVRQAGVVTCTVLTVALAVHGDWPGLALSGVAALASGLVMLLCWRFAGAGFGDVRLATLGGLGLGHATHRGLLLALAAFTLITVTQAVVTVMRGGDSRSTIPYGPALAVGFLLAVAL
jgi:leader peptidase (prepilin peptidase) / N-methyltransferase